MANRVVVESSNLRTDEIIREFQGPARTATRLICTAADTCHIGIHILSKQMAGPTSSAIWGNRSHERGAVSAGMSIIGP
jgi:hypothetical protein